MLTSFMRMRNFSLQGNLLQKKFFVFLNSPNSELCAVVNILLIKNGHSIYELRFQVYDLFCSKIIFIQAAIYNLFAAYLIEIVNRTS